jgi:hypothetical protein
MKRIQSIFPIVTRGQVFAALFAGILALSGFANADAMSSGHSHKGKKGSLTLTAPAEVGGVVLQPGNYEVREIKTPSGSVVEFTHLFRNELASELMRPDEEEVVARVASTEQALSTPPKHTQLLFAPNTTDAIALEIRGNAVDYLFAPAQLNSEASPSVVSTNGGAHE